MAISAEMPLVLAGLGIIHDDAMITVSIRYVKLVGLGIDKSFRRQPQVFYVVAPLGVVGLADLHQEFSVHGELQNHVVVPITGKIGLPFRQRLRRSGGAPLSGRSASAGACDPYVSFVVDGDAVQRIRPVIPFAWPAPMTEQGSALVKL